MKKFKIADLIVEIDFPDKYIYEDFYGFECEISEKSDVVWVLKQCEPEFPADIEWKAMNSFQIARHGNVVYAHYPDQTFYMLSGIQYEENYHKVFYYLPEELEAIYRDELKEDYEEHMQNYLFRFFREAFFFAIQQHNGISIHSASIIYRDCGFVFSASSGTGKSTHTNMWVENFQTPVLDGDVTVCRMINQIPYVYGLPWTGSSRLFTNRRVELKGVVFLAQATENEVKEITPMEFITRLIARSFTTRWFTDETQKGIKTTKEIIEYGVKGFQLQCNLDKSAAILMKDTIDSSIYE